MLSNAPTAGGPCRIGVLLGPSPALRGNHALKYLVCFLNTQQTAFEFEFLPIDDRDEFVVSVVRGVFGSRGSLKAAIPAFLERQRSQLESDIAGYSIQQAPPTKFILITTAILPDNYYSDRAHGLAILALGAWESWMAPPSIVEFAVTLVLRQAVALVSPSLAPSVHLGTKGCLCDFSASLADTKLHVLMGFVCHHCRAALVADGHPELPDELVTITQKKWIGTLQDPDSPACVSKKLGYDLFISRGLAPTFWESALATLQTAGINQLVTLVGYLLVLAFGVLVGHFLGH